MEFLDIWLFNTHMGFFRNSAYRHQIMAGILLALFSLQSAQASFCCSLDSTDAIEATESMPCHGDSGGLSQNDGCCLSCVTMMPPAQISAVPLTIGNAELAQLTHLDLLKRSDIPYRPPIYHLS